MCPQQNPSMNEKSNEERILYFGYGSNLDRKDWEKWCQRKGINPEGLKEIEPAWIDGFRMVFDYFSKTRNGGAANLQIVNSGNGATPGAIYEVDEYTKKALDRKEGHPNPQFYNRITTTAYTADGTAHNVFTYIHEPEKDQFHPPTEHYGNLIQNGLDRLDLPTNWLDAAKKVIPKQKFDLIFVYGTLMKGMSRHNIINEQCKFVCKGSVKGDLYDMEDYPGLVQGEGLVHGEVYRMNNPSQVIQYLDIIEGIDREPPLFKRVIQQVETDNGLIWAYTYHYGNSVKSLDKIEDGVWQST